MAQAALAREAGISPSYLNLIEHGRRPIGGARLNRIAEVLGVPASALSEDAEVGLADALRAAGAAGGVPAAALDAAPEIARRHPDWARAVVAGADALADRARTIAVLSDRLTHDPTLAGALHELLSTVSVVRSTAAILAQTPDLDDNWLRRFHANLDDESRRLAEGAEAVVGYFDRPENGDDGGLLPAERAARFLESGDFAALEEGGAAAIPDLVAGLPAEAAALAAASLREMARDARRLPAVLVDAAEAPEALLASAEGDLPLVLRRMAARGAGRGLLVVDPAGAILRRRAVPGFPLPALGAGCPLWPVWEALSQPGRPVRLTLETPDGARWMAHAAAETVAPGTFELPPVIRATMLLTRADGRAAGPARPVGPACRICPRLSCAARREPSILSDGVGSGAEGARAYPGPNALDMPGPEAEYDALR
jgi:transcriptional regulator with XRE-family HTH domain